MFENWWYKKEAPLLGSWSLGGGVALFKRKPASVEASGGNIDATSPGNGYKYHVFTSPGSFVVTAIGDCDVLIIGGGGAGGGNPAYGGGGGGAGALHYLPQIEVAATTYTVTIGGGGDNASTNNANRKGGDTVFGPGTPHATTAEGGGQAGWNPDPVGNWSGFEGGSGGGSSQGGYSGGTETGSNAHPGGNNIGSPPAGWGCVGASNNDGDGAGGGGSLTTGDGGPNSPIGRAGNGGKGALYPNFSSDLFPTMPANWIAAVGPLGCYASGGGGGGHNSNHHGGAGGAGPLPGGSPTGAPYPDPSGFIPGNGGAGNGGWGSTPSPGAGGKQAIANTGSGGGGAGNARGYANAAPGATGIVIVRYEA